MRSCPVLKFLPPFRGTTCCKVPNRPRWSSGLQCTRIRICLLPMDQMNGRRGRQSPACGSRVHKLRYEDHHHRNCPHIHYAVPNLYPTNSRTALSTGISQRPPTPDPAEATHHGNYGIHPLLENIPYIQSNTLQKFGQASIPTLPMALASTTQPPLIGAVS